MINVRTKAHTEIYFYMFDLSVFGLRLLAGASITLRSVRFMRSPKWKNGDFSFRIFPPLWSPGFALLYNCVRKLPDGFSCANDNDIFVVVFVKRVKSDCVVIRVY